MMKVSWHKKKEYKKNSLVNFADLDQLSNIGEHYRHPKCIVQLFFRSSIASINLKNAQTHSHNGIKGRQLLKIPFCIRSTGKRHMNFKLGSNNWIRRCAGGALSEKSLHKLLLLFTLIQIHTKAKQRSHAWRSLTQSNGSNKEYNDEVSAKTDLKQLEKCLQSGHIRCAHGGTLESTLTALVVEKIYLTQFMQSQNLHFFSRSLCCVLWIYI